MEPKMVKVRVQKEAKNSKSHLKARTDYLQQAATYLQNVYLQGRTATGTKSTDLETALGNEETSEQPAPQATSPKKDVSMSMSSGPATQRTMKKPLANLSRMCISHMRGVSLKTQTRLPVTVKRSFCKRCDTLLLPGVNCLQEVRNDSRGRKKPWADVRVLRCLVCDTEKRFPQTEKRSEKLSERRKKLLEHRNQLEQLKLQAHQGLTGTS
ncbi:uncharacterized protein N7482_004968 [Penicillium canariense]|uniref:RNAse P Rpr2/Rpp21 subunit domain protein n=1 Tax=Penicillium canariense TaxID=189055 RepID=A0A9W9I733_9EURO|nr:uncharacterized protein N7482_004968 [Penicillium canariense]KAJ5166187.1 hypothetical protein N7482_004968 [Penicillium canariense]